LRWWKVHICCESKEEVGRRWKEVFRYIIYIPESWGILRILAYLLPSNRRKWWIVRNLPVWEMLSRLREGDRIEGRMTWGIGENMDDVICNG
jgi:hypothetical protein